MNSATKITALDVVSQLRLILSSSNHGVGSVAMLKDLMELMEDYDKTLADSAIQLEHLTQEQADDKTLQAIGHKYGMTMNQVVGFLDTCNALNSDQHLNDCGVIAVPFWFHAQYIELQEQNKALIEETDSLMLTLDKVKSNVPATQLESLGVDLPERKSIITGVTQPYIPGVTGARQGDEHLDRDNVYLGDVRGKS